MARILVQSIARYNRSAIAEELRRDVTRLVRSQVQVRRRDALHDRMVATTGLSYIHLPSEMAISRYSRYAAAPPKAIGTRQLTFSGQTLVMRCMPGPHDLGGKDFGPVKQSDHVRSEWDNRVDALLKLMLDGHRFRVDELRRAIESLPEREYMSFSYYQKWLAAIRILIVEKGFLSEDEISVRLDQLRQKASV